VFTAIVLIATCSWMIVPSIVMVPVPPLIGVSAYARNESDRASIPLRSRAGWGARDGRAEGWCGVSSSTWSSAVANTGCTSQTVRHAAS
jgi:hypothetical protein